MVGSPFVYHDEHHARCTDADASTKPGFDRVDLAPVYLDKRCRSVPIPTSGCDFADIPRSHRRYIGHHRRQLQTLRSCEWENVLLARECDRAGICRTLVGGTHLCHNSGNAGNACTDVAGRQLEGCTVKRTNGLAAGGRSCTISCTSLGRSYLRNDRVRRFDSCRRSVSAGKPPEQYRI